MSERPPTTFERSFQSLACVVIAVGNFLVWHELVGVSEVLAAVIALAPLAVVSDRMPVD